MSLEHQINDKIHWLSEKICQQEKAIEQLTDIIAVTNRRLVEIHQEINKNIVISGDKLHQ